MSEDQWKHRLAAVVAAHPKSMRAISMAAGKGPGYLHSIINEGKEPTVGSLMDVCREMGASVTFILTGQSMSGRDEEILSLLRKADPDEKRMVVELLQKLVSSKE